MANDGSVGLVLGVTLLAAAAPRRRSRAALRRSVWRLCFCSIALLLRPLLITFCRISCLRRRSPVRAAAESMP